jgi:hypothetical protein
MIFLPSTITTFVIFPGDTVTKDANSTGQAKIMI